VVLTHGNGPQVGAALTRSELAAAYAYRLPLDCCVATTQGEIGYVLQYAMWQMLQQEGLQTPVVSLVTQVLVDSKDPAFKNPTKPIGPYYEEAQAKQLAGEQGWTVAPDAHGGWRRVVPSPAPYSIVEASVITQLVADGVIVIASGGGGVPVLDVGPRLVGVEAVVDKDLAGAILARDVGAKVLLGLTDVRGVFRGYGTDHEEFVDRLTVDQAQRLLDEGALGVGSMAPKVQAAVNFLEAGGDRATIASLAEAPDAVEGLAGTQITR
jgi:carbamate kinase